VSKSRELKVIATAANQAEGELIVARLAQAGIVAVEQRVSGNPEFGGGGWRYVYVQASELERARDVLAVEQPPFSDEELTRLSEDAAREARE
jgi:predicted transcriptional regulator